MIKRLNGNTPKSTDMTHIEHSCFNADIVNGRKLINQSTRIVPYKSIHYYFFGNTLLFHLK